MRRFAPIGLAWVVFAAQLGACKDAKERRAPAAKDEPPPTPATAADAKAESAISVDDRLLHGPYGVVKGVVKFTGTAPEMPMLQNGSDPVCAQKKMRAETILVNGNGTLKNVVVRVKPKTVASLVPKTPVVVKQIDCMYRPRIQGGVVGQELLVKNTDETAHNVHMRAAAIGDRQGQTALWNRQQPKSSSGLAPIKSVIEDHPVMRLKCDQHGWMSGYILVSDNPYSVVTQDDGSFTLEVPVGDLVIEAWHEFYGLKEARVSVAADATTSVEFTFDAAADNATAPASPAKGT